MKIQHLIGLCLTGFLTIHCAQKTVKVEGTASTTDSSLTLQGHGSSSGSDQKSLDPKAVEKINETFGAVFRNDDKKAKLGYGRNHRLMPASMQFALDMRFKNYDHGSGLLSQLSKDPEEVQFWEQIIKRKPGKLSGAICEALVKNEGFSQKPLKTSREDIAWSRELEHLKQSMGEKERLAAKVAPKKSPLDEEISGSLSCNTEGKDFEQWKCLPLTEEQRKTLLSESFLDKVHNMQRRDIRTVREIFRNPMKLATYQRYVGEATLYKFWLALQATSFDRQMHFARRLKGMARDMRGESFMGRYLGNLILDDSNDKKFFGRLENFADGNPLLMHATQMSYDLAQCHLSTK